MAINKGDIAAAQKALLLVPGLSGAVRQVGGFILAHYNVLTGRCDPSTSRLAKECGLGVRTVKDAIETLDARDLVKYVLHGGTNQANAYFPNFKLLREECRKAEAIALDRDAPDAPEHSARYHRRENAKRKAAGSRKGGAENRTAYGAENRTGSGAENCTRTLRTNSIEDNSIVSLPSRPHQAAPSQGLLNEGERHQLQSLLARAQSATPKPAEAARNAAERRIDQHFQKRGTAVYSLYCEVTGGEAYEVAVSAEIAKAYSGIPDLEATLNEVARQRTIARAAA